jgi:hypothetical protein
VENRGVQAWIVAQPSTLFLLTRPLPQSIVVITVLEDRRAAKIPLSGMTPKTFNNLL